MFTSILLLISDTMPARAPTNPSRTMTSPPALLLILALTVALMVPQSARAAK